MWSSSVVSAGEIGENSFCSEANANLEDRCKEMLKTFRCGCCKVIWRQQKEAVCDASVALEHIFLAQSICQIISCNWLWLYSFLRLHHGELALMIQIRCA